MVEEAERYKNEDEELRVKIEAKNRMEEQIYQLKSTYSGSDSKVDADTKQKINDIIQEYELWHSVSASASKEDYETRSKEMMDKVAEITANMPTDDKPTNKPSPTVPSEEEDDGPAIEEID
jgi:molecular chaperone DnaK (HSP70)